MNSQTNLYGLIILYMNFHVKSVPALSISVLGPHDSVTYWVLKENTKAGYVTEHERNVLC